MSSLQKPRILVAIVDDHEMVRMSLFTAYINISSESLDKGKQPPKLNKYQTLLESRWGQRVLSRYTRPWLSMKASSTIPKV
jgi:hypothetical protein